MNVGMEADVKKNVASVAAVYEHSDNPELASLLRMSSAELVETDYDNWDGGTYTYALQLRVPPKLFAAIAHRLGRVEEILLERFKLVTRSYSNERLRSVIILPML